MCHLDPADLLVACRRVLGRHPTNGPLWSACSELLSEASPGTGDWQRIVHRLEEDRTGAQLAAALHDDARVLVTSWCPTIASGLARRGDVSVIVAGRSSGSDAAARMLRRDELDVESIEMEESAIAAASADLVLIEADATSTSCAIAPAGSSVLAAVAAVAGLPVWLVAGRYRRLPAMYLDAIVDHITRGGSRRTDQLDPARCASVIGPVGAAEPSPASLSPECPPVAELLASLR